MQIANIAPFQWHLKIVQINAAHEVVPQDVSSTGGMSQLKCKDGEEGRILMEKFYFTKRLWEGTWNY